VLFWVLIKLNPIEIIENVIKQLIIIIFEFLDIF